MPCARLASAMVPALFLTLQSLYFHRAILRMVGSLQFGRYYAGIDAKTVYRATNVLQVHNLLFSVHARDWRPLSHSQYAGFLLCNRRAIARDTSTPEG